MTFEASIEDCYAALAWLFENAEAVGVDANRIVIAGASSGGGKCAGLALLNRDRDSFPIRAQALLCPMLDNLQETESCRVDGHMIWDRTANREAWEMYLGGTPGTDASPYASPFRAATLAALPPALIVVGSADIFRDESVDYAQQLMRDQTPCELAVIQGVPHGGDVFVPDARASKRFKSTYLNFLRDVLI